jgi:hypothetical protein
MDAADFIGLPFWALVSIIVLVICEVAANSNI